MEALFSCIEKKEKEYLELLKALVCIESYTPDKQGVDAVGACLRKFAEARGFSVQIRPFEKAGDGMLITMNADAPLPPVVYTGHLDTVFPVGTFPTLWREEDGKLFGPGVVDMKGGLVQGLLAMDALQETGWRERPVKFIIIPDEEFSESFSGEEGKDFIRDNAKGAAAAITLEANIPGKVTVGRKGSIRYKVSVHGRAAHAGSAYADGISAIKEAAHKILDIEAPSDPAQITYNCGVMQGGTSPNTVPGEATFLLYNRYWKLAQRQEIRDHVEGILKKSYIPGTKTDYEITGGRLPMDASEANYRLAAHIDAVSRRYGFGAMEPVLRASGSDASYTAMAGAPSVCSMGPQGGRAHSPEEFLYADSLVRQAKLLAAVTKELPADFG